MLTGHQRRQLKVNDRLDKPQPDRKRTAPLIDTPLTAATTPRFSLLRRVLNGAACGSRTSLRFSSGCCPDPATAGGPRTRVTELLARPKARPWRGWGIRFPTPRPGGNDQCVSEASPSNSQSQSTQRFFPGKNPPNAKINPLAAWRGYLQ